MRDQRDPNSQFENDLKQALDQSSDTLDGKTLSRLRQARTKALESPYKPNYFSHWGPVAAAASVSALAIGLWLYQPTQENHTMMANLEDLELLAAQEDIEFYEDLDFYLWLESQESQG